MQIGKYNFEGDDSLLFEHAKLRDLLQLQLKMPGLTEEQRKDTINALTLVQTEPVPWPPSETLYQQCERFASVLDRVAEKQGSGFPELVLLNPSGQLSAGIRSQSVEISYQHLNERDLPTPVLEWIMHHEMNHRKQRDPELLTLLSHLQAPASLYQMIVYAAQHDPNALYAQAKQQGILQLLPLCMERWDRVVSENLDAVYQAGLGVDSVLGNYQALGTQHGRIVALLDGPTDELEKARKTAKAMRPFAVHLPTSRRMTEELSSQTFTDEMWQHLLQSMPLKEITISDSFQSSPVPDKETFLTAITKYVVRPQYDLSTLSALQESVGNAQEYRSDDSPTKYGVAIQDIERSFEVLRKSERDATGKNVDHESKSHPTLGKRLERQCYIHRFLDTQQKAGCGRDVEAAIKRANQEFLGDIAPNLPSRGRGI